METLPKVNIPGMDVRSEVLSESLFLESTVSIFLASLLGIKDIQNKSSVLNNMSFNNKVTLLIEIGAFETEVKEKFQYFMTARNKFMHNIDVSSFEKCFTGDRAATLLIMYPQKTTLSTEEQLRKAFELLTSEIKSTAILLITKVQDKFVNRIKVEAFEKMADCNQDTGKFIEKYIEKAISENKPIREMKELSQLVQKNISTFWLTFADKVESEKRSMLTS